MKRLKVKNLFIGIFASAAAFVAFPSVTANAEVVYPDGISVINISENNECHIDGAFCYYDVEKYTVYDNNGKLLLKESTEYDLDTGLKSRYESLDCETNYGVYDIFDYDDDGNLIGRSRYNLSDESLVEYDVYENNAKGDPIRQTRYDNNGDVKYCWIYEREYDANGYPITETIKCYESVDTYLGKIVTEYYANSSEEHIRSEYNQSDIKDSYYVMTYDVREIGGVTKWLKKTQQVYRHLPYMADGQYDPSTKLEWYYDDNGNLTTVKEYLSGDYFKHKDIYQYDKDGNLVKTERYDSNNELIKWEEYDYYKKVYDDEETYINFSDFTAPEGCVYQFRLYNPNSGEHFYTGSQEEAVNLVKVGWNFEGSGFITPTVGIPIYRLYSAEHGDHFYTTSESERDALLADNWTLDGDTGIAFPSATAETGRPMYRLLNPNAYPNGEAGAHHFTMSLEEVENLQAEGWQYEFIAWYSV